MEFLMSRIAMEPRTSGRWVFVGRKMADRPSSGADAQTIVGGCEALLGSTAYFGAFSVDPEEQSVTHHRIDHIVPNQATIDATRLYHFEGDRLTLTLPNGSVRLVWRRLR